MFWKDILMQFGKSNEEDNSSTSGWVFMFRRGAILWASKKQTCVANSTMCSEFISLASASKEAEWLRNVMYEIPLLVKPISTVAIHSDSDLALNKAYSQTYNGKSRHIAQRHSLVHDPIKGRVIFVDYVNTKLNKADQFTEPLNKNSLEFSA